ncbi:c-type cytochrome [Erythrobacter sp. Alg231-14]|uniref:c-type cytochrome n=1 Tax=Erythrobacter sp. Alg231-14 TaxID=1922225 RepID=UPI00307B3243
MKRISKARLITATPLIALLAACGGEAADAPQGTEAQSEAPSEIAERQDNFEGIGDSFKVIREQLETEAPDMAAIQTAAGDINTRLQRLPDLFPEGTSMEAGFDTEALAVIWEDPDGFAEATQNAIAASEEMMAAAASGDPAAVGAQVGNIGLNGCKACHDKFRVDDD